jgi:chromosome segregation ATPase
MDVRMQEVSQNHEVLVSRVEDLEDNMEVVKTDVDTLRIEMSSYHQDINVIEVSVKDIKMSVNNTHLHLEKFEDHVNGFVETARRISVVSETNSRSLGMEIQWVQRETHGQIEGFYKKFERVNKIIDKKMVCLDEELDRVMALVGEKINAGMEELKAEFLEVLEVEGRRYGVLARDVELVKSRLETAQETNILLVSRLGAFQARVMELEDALMEGSEDAKGEPSESSSDLEPVENMVAIPIPAPSVVRTLVPVEVASKFIPPSHHLTPSPPYVAEWLEDPEHSGVPEFWVDPGVDQ